VLNAAAGDPAVSIAVIIGDVVDDSVISGLAGAAALEVVSAGGNDVLYVAGTADPTLVALSLDPGLSPLESVTATPGAGSVGLADLISVVGPSGPALLALGRYDSAPGYYSISVSGTLGAVTALGDGSAIYQRVVTGVSYLAGGESYVAIASFGQPDLQILRLEAGPLAVPTDRLADTPGLPLGDVVALEEAVLHGQRMLFAASGFDAGVAAMRIQGDGSLSVTDAHLPDEATGFSYVSALGTAEIGPRAFVLFTATGTDSLHVLRVSAGGRLNEVDVFYDIRETRIANAQALEVFEAADRTFVAVAGGDDGVSVFELTWQGQLVHLTTIADDFPTTLASVSDLAAIVDGDTVRLFASSPTDHGVTELLIDAARSGSVMMGGAVPDTLIVTAGDDEIWGLGRSDFLSGGDGNDCLIDGRGRDTLIGGAGADVFVFVEDGRSDFVEDFEIGVDRIDLSAFDQVYHISALQIGARVGGAVIFVGEDIIRVRDGTGGPIDADLFTQDDFIFG